MPLTPLLHTSLRFPSYIILEEPSPPILASGLSTAEWRWLSSYLTAFYNLLHLWEAVFPFAMVWNARGYRVPLLASCPVSGIREAGSCLILSSSASSRRQLELSWRLPTARFPQKCWLLWVSLLIFYALNFKHGRGAQAARWGDLAIMFSLASFPSISLQTGLWVAPINSCLEATNQSFLLVEFYNLLCGDGEVWGLSTSPELHLDRVGVLWVNLLRRHCGRPNSRGTGGKGREENCA